MFLLRICARILFFSSRRSCIWYNRRSTAVAMSDTVYLKIGTNLVFFPSNAPWLLLGEYWLKNTCMFQFVNQQVDYIQGCCLSSAERRSRRWEWRLHRTIHHVCLMRLCSRSGMLSVSPLSSSLCIVIALMYPFTSTGTDIITDNFLLADGSCFGRFFASLCVCPVVVHFYWGLQELHYVQILPT